MICPNCLEDIKVASGPECPFCGVNMISFANSHFRDKTLRVPTTTTSAAFNEEAPSEATVEFESIAPTVHLGSDGDIPPNFVSPFVANELPQDAEEISLAVQRVLEEDQETPEPAVKSLHKPTDKLQAFVDKISKSIEGGLETVFESTSSVNTILDSAMSSGLKSLDESEGYTQSFEDPALTQPVLASKLDLAYQSAIPSAPKVECNHQVPSLGTSQGYTHGLPGSVQYSSSNPESVSPFVSMQQTGHPRSQQPSAINRRSVPQQLKVSQPRAPQQRAASPSKTKRTSAEDRHERYYNLESLQILLTCIVPALYLWSEVFPLPIVGVVLGMCTVIWGRKSYLAVMGTAVSWLCLILQLAAIYDSLFPAILK